MNMFAKFDEIQAMTLQDIKEIKRYGQMDNVKTVYPPQTKFARGIINQDSKMTLHVLKSRFYIKPWLQ